jgi:hypothetical protein
LPDESSDGVSPGEESLRYTFRKAGKMTTVEETRKLRNDLLALELRDLSARVDALQKQMSAPFDLLDIAASERHDQFMRAISRLANLDGLRERITRIEARERSS